jgi:hypothetical protein
MAMDKTLELADINAAAFLSLQDIPVTLINRAGRVYFVVPAEDRTYRELARLQSNPEVPILDFINRLKRLRSQMLDARDYGNGQRRMENGKMHSS